MIAEAAHKGDQPFFFQLLADHPQYFIAVLQVYGAGGWTEMSGNCSNNGMLVLLR